jgi:hypothetical protein
MCELLISVVDKGDDTHWVKRGTIIETFEDGHAYGAQELANPMFRIIQLPGAPAAFGRSFMGGEIGQSSSARPQLARLFRIDIDHPSIPAAMRSYLDDDSRAQPTHRVDTNALPLTVLTALKTIRRIDDPAVVGEPSNVIG